MMKFELGVRNQKIAPINDIIVWNYRLNNLKSEKNTISDGWVFLFFFCNFGSRSHSPWNVCHLQTMQFSVWSLQEYTCYKYLANLNCSYKIPKTYGLNDFSIDIVVHFIRTIECKIICTFSCKNYTDIVNNTLLLTALKMVFDDFVILLEEGHCVCLKGMRNLASNQN